MLVNKKGYYVIKVVLFFAFSKKESFSSKELSERLEISEKVIEQVLLFLKNKGILSSKRGPQGGYKLLVDVSEMTVMDMIEMTGTNLDVLPIERSRKKKVIDGILGDMEREVMDGITSKLNKVRIKDLVSIMKEKVTEKGLSYMI
ncbi:MAG: Rrf2 family transcriptional regulator [Candidatus Omnitrophota bacterium]